MLVIISDLHLVDGSAGDHNVKGEAFQLWMEELLALALARRANELVLLFLGDIIDLIRTEQWFDVPPEDRPWGSAAVLEDPQAITPACRARARQVLAETARAAREPLEILSGRHPGLRERLAALGIPVRRVYIPGNHDRLVLLDPALREETNALLGIDTRGVEGLGDHVLESRRYGVLARHGHEFDLWNFEACEPGRFQYDASDYLKVPIGDVLTTELAARIPWAARRRLIEQGLPQDVVEGVYRRLQDIENVRPLAACIQWIYYESAQMKEQSSWPQPVRDAVSEAVERTAMEVYDALMELPFVRAWLKRHDRFLNPLDEADRLYALHALFRTGVRLDTMRYFLAAPEKLGIISTGANRRAALGEPALSDPRSGIHHVVYGHTHVQEQVALRCVEGHEKIYFNSGTWRPRFTRADDQTHFVQWKEMTYLVFYNEEEDPLPEGRTERKGISFETWTGTMLKRGR